MIRATQTTVFVDGNNVVGSRPDGWWRDRTGAVRRLVAEIIPLAVSHGGIWTIVFDGKEPPPMPPSPDCLKVVHSGYGRRDGAHDRIVELVHEHPDPATSLVYTTDAMLRARVKALGTQVMGFRTLQRQLANAPDRCGGVVHARARDGALQAHHGTALSAHPDRHLLPALGPSAPPAGWR